MCWAVVGIIARDCVGRVICSRVFDCCAFWTVSWARRRLAYRQLCCLEGFMQEQSANVDIDAGASCAQLMLAHLNARCWFEYVESDLNWVDGASRAPDAGPFLKSGVSHSMAHSPDLAVDGLALLANKFMLARLNARCWFESVESKIKLGGLRFLELEADPLLRNRGFSISWPTIHAWPWTVPVDERAAFVNVWVGAALE